MIASDTSTISLVDSGVVWTLGASGVVWILGASGVGMDRVAQRITFTSRTNGGSVS